MIQKMVKSLLSKDCKKTRLFALTKFADFFKKNSVGANSFLTDPLQTAAQFYPQNCSNTLWLRSQYVAAFASSCFLNTFLYSYTTSTTLFLGNGIYFQQMIQCHKI